ncbi:hypothetical protein [Microbacterium sp. P05]|uniref:hypothetical protein n=1 Tax=Microbacterium sp. P05 TaxID=3366948 RepID=UPI0037451ECE
MSVTTVRPEIAQFAASVREHLDDLADDDVDELTGGLEADLSDQAAEAGDTFEMPDAAAYAAELRAAGGLPERGERRRKRRSVRAWWSAVGSNLAATARDYRFGAWLLDTLGSLVPVWWIARAFALYMLLVIFVGIPRPLGNDLVDRARALYSDPRATLLLVALLLLSIQWGRGRWATASWLVLVRNGVSIVAAIALPFLFFGLLSGAQEVVMSSAAMSQNGPTPGLAVDGQRVRNIFAYDANGEPIDHVQLFDQDGRPLTTVGTYGQREGWDYYFYGGGGPTPVAEREIGRQPVWNVFPLREVSPSDATAGEPNVDAAFAPIFPFPRVPAIAGTLTDAAQPEATPSITETPAP